MLLSLRAGLRTWVEGGNETVAAVQRACGVPLPRSTRGRTLSECANARDGAAASDERGYWYWHLLFSAGATLGNEVFYITFLPLMFWEIDCTAGRRCGLRGVGVCWRQLTLRARSDPALVAAHVRGPGAQGYAMPAAARVAACRTARGALRGGVW